MTLPRSIRRQRHLDRLWQAQSGHCYLCGRPMGQEYRYTVRLGWSADHVNARTRGFTRKGNVLLAHKCCNAKKGSRPAKPCELLLLEGINAQLQARMA